MTNVPASRSPDPPLVESAFGNLLRMLTTIPVDDDQARSRLRVGRSGSLPGRDPAASTIIVREN
ncbi:hypothetical protein [Nonomuraea sp. JJY05]|uniref:hypothetical protein n=1 Tax=Nonomuraea sp. JJY05 TaxID=3350255 RepID=UPI00373F8AD3